MRLRLLLVGWTLLTLAAAPAAGQFIRRDMGGPSLGDSKTQRWKAGMTVKAAGGPCFNLVGTAPVPIDWPEQQTRIVDEDVSPGVHLSYRTVDGSVKQMVVSIPYLPAGTEVHALVTTEVQRHAILAPDSTDGYELPDKRRIPREVRVFLAPSPGIESTSSKIRRLAKEIGADGENAWGRVEAIYDWVREHVEYKEGPFRGALAALNDGVGDCEELTSLFIAICRASDVPARTVWVDGHCYPEFYLVDDEGEGHWFPCQAAGSRAFGGIPEFRPILQKGDNFRSPSNPRDHKRYLAETLTGKGGKPSRKFVRELLAQ